MLWRRTQNRGSSPLPTHSEYFVSPCPLDKALRISPPTPEHHSVRMFRELKK
ncbi:hypothetical protein ALC56_02623 [Trachymyrmex septentrionalis]|uniref:Uncharacterized protein n=1 Tax=Trachymyrmex septentrionalis TaxID=34720 RepID=A0A195FQW6_9HYME|nr:hypothetical protein ALC56_02623 [Trachymyrmex septentrionalis]